MNHILVAIAVLCMTSMVLSVPIQEQQPAAAATRENCNGTHERLIQVGGGCIANANGVSICADPKPPICECVEGFERNGTSKACEAKQVAECNGPHEHWIQIGGGCYRPTPDSPAICLPPKEPECVCESGYERNPVTKLCEAIVITNSKKRI